MSAADPAIDASKFPRFVTCRVKRAVKITFMQENPGDSVTLHFDGEHAPIEVPFEWVRTRRAQPGGYLVVYEDGYSSWEPAQSILKNSVPAEDWGIPRSQDPKYGINLRGKFFNRSTGAEIPAGMPTMTFIAQDRKALPMLSYYRSLLEIPSAQGSVDERLLAFSDYATRYPQNMKEPDGRAPPPPVAHSITRPGPATNSPSGE